MGEMVGLITGRVRYLKPAEHPMTQRQGVLQECKQRLSFLAVRLDDPITRTLWVSTPCINAFDPYSCQDTRDEQGRSNNQESEFFFVVGHKSFPKKVIELGKCRSY